MITKRIAIMGDVHGCLKELQDLYSKLCHESIDEIRHSGDLVDRGPDSAGVVAFCRENGIQGVRGNHEESILQHIDRVMAGGHLPKNPEKARTLSQLKNPLDIQYLKDLKPMHIDDALGLVSVHGGVWPGLPWERQPSNICRAQLIHPDKPGETLWFLEDRKGIPEAVHLSNGWVRWYKVYDHDYHVTYGHSAWQKGPKLDRNPGAGYTIGLDTGCNWTGELTAVILPDLRFIATSKTRQETKRFNDAYD